MRKAGLALVNMEFGAEDDDARLMDLARIALGDGAQLSQVRRHLCEMLYNGDVSTIAYEHLKDQGLLADAGPFPNKVCSFEIP